MNVEMKSTTSICRKTTFPLFTREMSGIGPIGCEGFELGQSYTTIYVKKKAQDLIKKLLLSPSNQYIIEAFKFFFIFSIFIYH